MENYIYYLPIIIALVFIIHRQLTVNKKWDIFLQQFHAQPSESSILEEPEDIEKTIPFAGQITGPYKEDFRRLYCKRKPFYPIFYFLLAVAFIIMIIYEIARTPKFDFLTFLEHNFVLIIIVILLFFLAFRVAQYRWNWWWRKFESHIGNSISGEINELGIRLTPHSMLLSWENFEAAKIHSKIIIIYMHREFSYPLHRSMFKTVTEWNEVNNIVKSNISNVFEVSTI